MRVTIKEVAKRARVAVGTVSRVINQHPQVDPKLRARVEQVIRELNYRPNARAQSFVRDSSPIVSFILSNRDFLHPVHSRILQGVEEYCQEAGYLVIYTKFVYTPGAAPSELRLPRVLRSHGIADSVILAGTNYDNFSEALENLGVPYVLLANNFITQKPRPPLDQVRIDDFTGAVEATSYLIRLGHTRICYVGDITLPWFRTRYEAYLKAMREHDLEPCAYTLGLSDNPYANGYACAEMMFDKQRSVTAVFGGNDEVAFGVWDFLATKGLRVPSDVSIIGFNDDENAQFKVPPLATVRVEKEEVGRQLAKMAISKLQSPQRRFPEVVLPTTLIKRGTVRPPAGEILGAEVEERETSS